MISATHSHSTPGGFMLHMLFDLTTFGFVRETFDAMVNGITKVNDYRNFEAKCNSKYLIVKKEDSFNEIMQY